MIIGSLIVAMCLLVLGWTAEIVGLFVKDAEKVNREACRDLGKGSHVYYLLGQQSYHCASGP